MRWLAPITLLITSILVLIISYLLNEKINYYKATINEYEFVLSECWKENKHVKERLGSFYVPRKERKSVKAKHK